MKMILKLRNKNHNHKLIMTLINFLELNIESNAMMNILS